MGSFLLTYILLFCSPSVYSRWIKLLPDSSENYQPPQGVTGFGHVGLLYAWVLMQLATAQAGIIPGEEGDCLKWLGTQGEGIIPGLLDPWPQNHTSAWLVSDQLVLSP